MVYFGAKVGHDAPRWTQEGPHELQSSEKRHLQKCCFPIGKPNLLSLGGSQDEHKMLKTALKKHLKGFKTQEIRGSKLDLKISSCWVSFGVDLEPKTDLKIDKERVQK